jgi:hypothetical protein
MIGHAHKGIFFQTEVRDLSLHHKSFMSGYPGEKVSEKIQVLLGCSPDALLY